MPSIIESLRALNKKRRDKRREKRRDKQHEKQHEFIAWQTAWHHAPRLFEILNEYSDSSPKENPEQWFKYKLGLAEALSPDASNKTNAPSSKKIDSVLFEAPVAWIDQEIFATSKPTTEYYVNMSKVLLDLNLNVELTATMGRSCASPCLPNNNQICISYHSHGDEARVWRVKESYLPYYYTFDRLGYSGFSELAQFPENFTKAIKAFPIETAQKIVSDCRAKSIINNVSKFEQPDIADIKLPDDYIFYPMQRVIDSVALLARVSQVEALSYLAELSANANVPLIIKRHPRCEDNKMAKMLDSIVKKYPQTHLIDASIHQLIPRARAVVGANSGVLFEALIHGKAVYSFASSDFQLATINLQNKDDFTKVFEPAPKQTDQTVQFLGWYLKEYCFKSDEIESLKSKVVGCLENASLKTPMNLASRTYIKMIFTALEDARRATL